MLDHIILTVSNVERSLAFYEAALEPLNIKFFLSFRGEADHPDLWGFGDGKRATNTLIYRSSSYLSEHPRMRGCSCFAMTYAKIACEEVRGRATTDTNFLGEQFGE